MFFVRNLWVKNAIAMFDFSEGYNMPKKNQKIAEVFLGIRALVILESFLVFLSPFFLSVFLSFFLASFFLPWKHNTSQHHDDAGSSSAFFW